MPFTRDDPVDYDGVLISWDLFEIHPVPYLPGSQRRWRVEWSTNDDLDKGYPTRFAQDSFELADIRRVFKYVGGFTHHGAGSMVWVYYDGREVSTGAVMQQIIVRAEGWDDRHVAVTD